jgi:hypothetical protein
MLREEHMLRMFVNKILRMIFGLKRDVLTREWRKLREELCDFCFLPNIIQVINKKR